MENELISLQPNSFKTIQQFFTKYKSLVMQCKKCGLERKDENIVLSALSNLGSEYSVFFFTFHSGRNSIPNWKLPYLDSFVESLIQDQDNLVQMGVIQTSKNQALFMLDSKNAKSKGKHKGKEPKYTDSKPKENHRSSNGALCSKKKKNFKKAKCP